MMVSLFQARNWTFWVSWAIFHLSIETLRYILLDIICKRGKSIVKTGVNTRSGSHPKEEDFNEDDKQINHPDLKCGEISIPRVIKPMVGPAIKSFQNEINENKFFVFSLIKDLTINAVLGCLNFIVDTIKSIFTAKFKERF